jgi:hypothetical protein
MAAVRDEVGLDVIHTFTIPDEFQVSIERSSVLADRVIAATRAERGVLRAGR